MSDLPPRLKAPIIILAPGLTPNEAEILRKIVSNAKDAHSFKDRLFLILDSDLTTVLYNKEMLRNLANQLDILEDDFRKTNRR